MRAGLFAAVLNRPGSLGPAPGKASRGALPLDAVAEPSADAAAHAMLAIDGNAYRSFNMVLADRHGAHFLRGLGQGRIEGWRLPPGLHVVTAHDPDDPASPRGVAHRPRFAAAPVPDPDAGDWAAWAALLADRSGPPGAALNVPATGGFGTVCSALVGLPQAGPPVWLFAAGPPDQAPFRPVPLP